MTVGTYFERRGQLYYCIDARDHITRDGRETVVFTLETRCSTCGAEFETTAGPAALDDDNASLTRRCPTCRPKRGARCPHCGRTMRKGVRA